MNPIKWNNSFLEILDQTKLPLTEEFIEVNNLEGVISVIRDMNVRGAPAIGFTGIFGVAFIARDYPQTEWEIQIKKLEEARPTAVNLCYEVRRAYELIKNSTEDSFSLFEKVISFVLSEMKQAEVKHKEMANLGEVILKKYVHKDKFKLQTHCNTGRLACGSLGTALGVIEELSRKGQIEKVWVDETRPYLQGSRLTAFELEKLHVEYDIVVEGAASFLMSRGYVDAIFVGADRIAANGDTANKIGTANLAVIAQKYHVPFFVVAPLSSFDLSLATGRDIEIEMRSEKEILEINANQIAPYGARGFNPSFDITSNDLITAIICEKTIVEKPNTLNMKTLLEKYL